MKFIVTALSLALLAGCSTSPPPEEKQALTPVPPRVIDPDDDILRKNVKAFLVANKAPAASRYKVVRFDLDEDGRRDALVLFETPFGYWCGTHGCTMLVMKAHNDRFSMVNSIQPVREPLYISEIESNGWKDIVVRVSGRWNKASAEH